MQAYKLDNLLLENNFQENVWQHTRLPSLSTMTMKHWRSMTSQDPTMQEVFPEPQLNARKKPRWFFDQSQSHNKGIQSNKKKVQGNEKVWQSRPCLPLYTGKKKH